MDTPTIWDPLDMGALKLQHRVVLAPMTRNRATPSAQHDRTYYPNALMAQYYTERATPGGLLISEAIPTCLRASAFPGAAGFSTGEQIDGWRKVVAAVHDQGGVFVAQLWDPGRTAPSSGTGLQPWSSAASPISPANRSGIEYDVPHAMSVNEIHRVHDEYVRAAINAREAGFDGIEIHAANGYLPDQFHHSNINTRTDEYGGTLENRCRFTIELAKKLCDAVGADRIGFRLSPFGLFNETRGEDREAQWVYLCKELSSLGLAYIHLIEPRFDEFRTEMDKISLLGDVSLQPFRKAVAPGVAVIAAGGYTWDNAFDGVKRGDHDAVAFGRYFTSNPDLVDRLRSGQRFYRYHRSRFYGPFDDPEIGYTMFPEDLKVFADESDKGQPQLTPT